MYFHSCFQNTPQKSSLEPSLSGRLVSAWFPRVCKNSLFLHTFWGFGFIRVTQTNINFAVHAWKTSFSSNNSRNICAVALPFRGFWARNVEGMLLYWRYNCWFSGICIGNASVLFGRNHKTGEKWFQNLLGIFAKKQGKKKKWIHSNNWPFFNMQTKAHVLLLYIRKGSKRKPLKWLFQKNYHIFETLKNWKKINLFYMWNCDLYLYVISRGNYSLIVKQNHVISTTDYT